MTGAEAGASRATLVVTGADRGGALALAAAVASEAAAGSGRTALLAELGDEARRRPATLLAAPASRELESRLRARRDRLLRARPHLPPRRRGERGRPRAGRPAGGRRRGRDRRDRPASDLWGAALKLLPGYDPGPRAGLLVAALPRERSMAALAVAEMRSRGWKARVARSGPSLLAGRRALAGLRPGGAAGERAGRLAASLLGSAGAAGGFGSRSRQSGQALPAVLGACAVLGGCALVLASIGGAVTGKQRVQRAADLSALSATRAMRDSMPRLLAPARLPDGRLNPRHLSRAAYLREAELAAEVAAERNGVDPRPASHHLPGRRRDPAAPRAGPGAGRDRRGRAPRAASGSRTRPRRAGRRRRRRSPWWRPPSPRPGRGRAPRPGPGRRGRRPAAGTAGRSSTGTARGCARTWQPPTTGWPPPRPPRATR